MALRIPPVSPFLITGGKTKSGLHHPVIEQTGPACSSSVTQPKYERVEKLVLKNGIRVILQEIPNSTYSSLNIWLDVGSVHEDESNLGVTHFLEHSFFKGTKTKSAQDIARIIDEIGGDSENVNSYVEGEFTCFYANVLNEDLLKAIELFLDIIFNPRLDGSDIELEKKVVNEELSMHRDYGEVKRLIHKIALHKHPLGKAELQDESSLEKLSQSAIINYLKKHHTPDNLVISIAGNFDPKEVISQIESSTSHINSKKGDKNHVPPLSINNGVYVFNLNSEQTNIIVAIQGVSALKEDRYTLAMLNTALGSSWTSRLVQEIREKRGLAYKVFSSNENYAFGGILFIHIGINGKNLETALELILKELKDIKTSGLKEEEIERAKKRLKRNFLLGVNSPEQVASNNALCELYYERTIPQEEVLSSIEKITNEDIIKLARTIFNPKDFAVIVIGPHEEYSTEFLLKNLLDQS